MLYIQGVIDTKKGLLAICCACLLMMGWCARKSVADGISVTPRRNVIVNVAESSAAVLNLPLNQYYTVSASGTSYYAATGIYREIYVAYQSGQNQILKAGTGILDSLPIGQSRNVFPAGPVYFFFVEFGDGYTGDNRGSTTITARAMNGQTYSCVVDPRKPVVNIASSDAAELSLDVGHTYILEAKGEAYFAQPPGAYRYMGIAYKDNSDGSARLVNVPINFGSAMVNPVGPVYCFFVEFATGYLGDNGGTVAVTAQGVR